MSETKHITAEEVSDEVRLRMLQSEPESVKQYPDTKALRTRRAAMMLSIMAEEIAQRRNAQTDLLVACQALAARGFFTETKCADAETLKDMAAMRAAIIKAGGTP